jgi:hypothetical protein
LFAGHGTAIAGALFSIIVLAIALIYFVVGYLLHRRRRAGAWLGATVAALTLPLQLVMHLDVMWVSLTPAWLAIDALVLILLLTNWRRFEQPPPPTGP